jgi:putative membrane protein
MQGFLIKTVVNGIALWAAAAAIDGIRLGEDDPELSTRLLTIGLVALIFGIINAFVKPFAQLLSLPFIIITLGLFTLIVNAFMLQITEWVSEPLGLDFSIDAFFWDAVLGAIVITVVSMVVNLVVPDGK